MFISLGVITLKSHFAISCSILLIATWSLISLIWFTWWTVCSTSAPRPSAGRKCVKN